MIRIGSMNRNFALIALIVVGFATLLGGLFGRNLSRTLAETTFLDARIVSDYKEALDAIDQNYLGRVDLDRATDSSMQAMLWTLDPHSSFFTRDEFKKLYEEQSSQFYGIGVSILQHRDGVYVQSVV